jgi:hypothetical protein
MTGQAAGVVRQAYLPETIDIDFLVSDRAGIVTCARC